MIPGSLFVATMMLASALALFQTKAPLRAAVGADRTEELDLAIGENKTIQATDVLNYSEGSPGIADVKLTTDGSQFVIVGLKSGSTTLLLIFQFIMGASFGILGVLLAQPLLAVAAVTLQTMNERHQPRPGPPQEA